ncbi:MAG: ParA family protein [Herpetosiphon sp.]
MDERIPLREAARRFDVKVDRLRRAAYDGRLEATLVGNQRLVQPNEVARFLKRQVGEMKAVETGGGEHMARVIAVAVPKGGTGKTTTTLNLGAALVEQGKRVLLIDFDPQGSLTIALGFQPDALEKTIYSAVKFFLATFESQIEQVILPTPVGVDLAPCNTLLNLANEELVTAVQREYVLQKLLEPVLDRYDIILIDTLPYLGVLVVNALVAAQEVIVPLEAEYLATPSVSLIMKQVDLMRRSRLNPTLVVTGILLTKVDQRTVMSRETVAHSRKSIGAQVPVFETVIKRSVRFPESQAMHQSILQYDAHGDGASAYRALAQEVLHAEV